MLLSVTSTLWKGFIIHIRNKQEVTKVAFPKKPNMAKKHNSAPIYHNQLEGISQKYQIHRTPRYWKLTTRPPRGISVVYPAPSHHPSPSWYFFHRDTTELSGGAIVLGQLPGQAPAALAVDAGGVFFYVFLTRLSCLSSFSLCP